MSLRLRIYFSIKIAPYQNSPNFRSVIDFFMFYQLRFQDTEHQLLYLATLLKGTCDRYIVEFWNIFLKIKGHIRIASKGGVILIGQLQEDCLQ